MLMIKERLLSAGLAYKRLADLSLPRRFRWQEAGW
jgi:hypothetical protein